MLFLLALKTKKSLFLMRDTNFKKKNKQKKNINWEFKEKYQLRLISMFCLGLGTSKCVF